MLYVTRRTFRRNPHHNKGHYGPWTFRPKSSRTQVLDLSCPISGHFGSALVRSNQNLGNFWPVYVGLYINIENIINCAESEDLDQPVHPCSLIRVFRFTVMSLGFMATNRALSEHLDQSVCVVVQLANRRKVRVEVQRNTDGDTPCTCVAAHADLRLCGGHVIL